MDLPNLTILRELGSGASGNVYLAEHHLLQKQVVVKVMKTDGDSSQWIARFKREAQTMSKITNPHIPKVYSFFIEEPDRAVLVMEYIEGTSIQELIEKNGAFPPEQACQIMLELCESMQVAHELGIVHRDIKPSNILLSDSGIPHIIDFGVAKNLSAQELQKLTATGAFVGTPSYMSPEQCSGNVASAGADVYSLACVLFFMLTGRELFTGNTPAEVMMKHLNTEPDLSAVPIMDLRVLLALALEKQSASRLGSCADFAKQLKTADLTGSRALSARLKPLLVSAAVVCLALSCFIEWKYLSGSNKKASGNLAAVSFKPREFALYFETAEQESQKSNYKKSIEELKKAATLFSIASESEEGTKKLARDYEEFYLRRNSSPAKMTRVYFVLISACIAGHFDNNLKLAHSYFTKQMQIIVEHPEIAFVRSEAHRELPLEQLLSEQCKLLDAKGKYSASLQWLCELYDRMKQNNLLTDISEARFSLRSLIAYEYVRVQRPVVSDAVSDDMKHYALGRLSKAVREFSFANGSTIGEFSKALFESSVFYTSFVGSKDYALAIEFLKDSRHLLDRFNLVYPDVIAAFSSRLSCSDFYVPSEDIEFLDGCMIQAFRNAALEGKPTNVLHFHKGFECVVDHYRSFKNLKLTHHETRMREFEFVFRTREFFTEGTKYSFEEKLLCYATMGQYFLEESDCRNFKYLRARDGLIQIIEDASPWKLNEKACTQLEIAIRGASVAGLTKEPAQDLSRFANRLLETLRKQQFFHSDKIHAIALSQWFHVAVLTRQTDARDFDKHFSEFKKLEDKLLKSNSVCLSMLSSVCYIGDILTSLGRKDEAFVFQMDFVNRWNACESKPHHYDAPILAAALKNFKPGEHRLEDLVKDFQCSLTNADDDNFSSQAEKVWVTMVNRLPELIVEEKKDYSAAIKLPRDTLQAFKAKKCLMPRLESICLKKILSLSERSQQHLATEDETKRFKELLSSNKLGDDERN